MYAGKEQVLKINWGSIRYVGLVTFNRLGVDYTVTRLNITTLYNLIGNDSKRFPTSINQVVIL
jgi:hypothetical protein